MLLLDFFIFWYRDICHRTELVIFLFLSNAINQQKSTEQLGTRDVTILGLAEISRGFRRTISLGIACECKISSSPDIWSHRLGVRSFTSLWNPDHSALHNYPDFERPMSLFIVFLLFWHCLRGRGQHCNSSHLYIKLKLALEYKCILFLIMLIVHILNFCIFMCVDTYHNWY